MASPSTVHDKALAFATSYGAAMALSQDPSTASAIQVATALVAHYSPHFTSFSLGSISQMGSDPVAGVTGYLNLLQSSGLGYKIHNVRNEVKVISDAAAAVWMTFRIEPAVEGEEGWEWTNVYGWRDGGKQNGLSVEGKWEFAVSDQEIEGILKRRPDFLRGFGAA
ncbi:hypothetical protein TI39_contig4389g00004 [Zymoseptoria brevis]|uniref:SnoaL-like domain-containing protein n=1 Tax=Zymoseptoria brevis TaxID=1047168 RepID=A0A0F4G7Z4_9PEZI|nr:hypothetical protein TI39_contig4389g00004 [Zymoseptoria brevis]